MRMCLESHKIIQEMYLANVTNCNLKTNWLDQVLPAAKLKQLKC